MSSAPRLDSRALYFRLLGHVRPYTRVFLVSVLGMLVTAASEPVFPALMNFMLDSAFGARQQLLLDRIPATLIPALIVGLFLVRGIANLVSEYAISWVGSRVVMDLRDAMFRQLLRLPNRYFNEHATGNLISKLTFDVSQVTSAATKVVTVAIKDSLTVLGLLAYLFYLNWKLTLLSLTIGPAMAWVVRKVSRRLRQTSRVAQRAMGGVTSVLEETIECQRVVKIFGGQEYEARRFFDAINRLRQNQMKQITAAAASSPLVELLAACALSLIMYLAILQAAADQTSAGGFVAFVIAMMMLFAPLKRLTGVNEPLQRGLAAAESVFDLLDEQPEPDTGSGTLPRAQGRIEFRDVGFRYAPDSRPALSHVTLSIEPGETVALVGASGSGKTTLVNLIPRFYHPTEGRILLDGHDLEDLTLASLRANIALVSQDVVLFNDTVAANIAYGRLAQTPEAEIVRAAEAAHAMEFIRNMPEGLNTLIGENGVMLSGGQRQRLAIARALLKNAPILILDEATSALDTASERHVQAALETLMQGRTTIVIAHRLSTIENADRIVVLDAGRIAEVGSHAELLARGGLYARLYRMQFAEPQPAAVE